MTEILNLDSMKKIFLPLAAITSAAVLGSGCQTEETGALAPQNTTKYNLENTGNFVLLDKGAQKSITCSGLQVGKTSDGRLEVMAKVRNRENRRIEVQINCIFKDEQGFSTEDDPPFQALILTENSTEDVRFTAMNTKAKQYTIRVREAR